MQIQHCTVDYYLFQEPKSTGTLKCIQKKTRGTKNNVRVKFSLELMSLSEELTFL